MNISIISTFNIKFMNLIPGTFLFTGLFLSFTPQGVQRTAKINHGYPNVIFLLTDDQGYGDLACNGNPWIKTPNIDKLYSQSVRFTNFHVGTTSAPTRAGLMTGQYCNKLGVWHTINGREIMRYGVNTVAEVFQSSGYKTAIFGKWHLGDNYPFRPQDRGFDEVLIHGGGGVGQQPDYWNNDYFDDTYMHNGKPEKFTGYCTDIWYSEAIKFIKKNKKSHFFCYISSNAPHSPYNVEDRYSDLYKSNSQIPNPNFYGMITNIDENIGKLRTVLDSLGLSENTILVFMTDNGTAAGVKFDKEGNVISGYNAGMKGIKASPYDGGHRVPFLIYWPNGKIMKGKSISTITSYIDFMPTILDLCGLRQNIKNPIDGLSLKPLIYESTKEWPARTLFSDTQREEFLIKWKQSATMTNRWRLIGKDELYDMINDPGQKINVAASHRDLVDSLCATYERWWKDVAQNADEYNRVKIGTQFEYPVRLNSHDWHVENGVPAWSQSMVRAGTGKNGFLNIEVIKDGEYELELRRWPAESGLSLSDSAPAGDTVPGGQPYLKGEAITFMQAKIVIDGKTIIKELDNSAKGVKFRIELKKGNHNLITWLIDNKGIERGAYYVYIK
jgi:arylsulfatase A-like enzyme